MRIFFHDLQVWCQKILPVINRDNFKHACATLMHEVRGNQGLTCFVFPGGPVMEMRGCCVEGWGGAERSPMMWRDGLMRGCWGSCCRDYWKVTGSASSEAQCHSPPDHHAALSLRVKAQRTKSFHHITRIQYSKTQL